MLYRQFAMALSLLLSVSVAGTAQAQERAAMESWACNYVEGKGYADLMNVAAKWDAWASKNHPAPYSAYVLSPVFATFEEVPEAVWLGFSPTSRQLGAVADQWMSETGDLIDEFNSVVDCGAHTLAGSRTIRAYEKVGEAGIVQLRSCTANEGVSWGQIAKADQAWADFMTENELPGGIYRWGAGPGTAKDSKMDFYAVWITESLEQRGTAMDKFREVEGAGDTYYNIYGDENLYTCDNSRIYYATPVGGSD